MSSNLIKKPLDELDRLVLLQGQLTDDEINAVFWNDDYLDAIKSDPVNKKISNELNDFMSYLSKKYPGKHIHATGDPDNQDSGYQGYTMYWSFKKVD